MTWCIIIFLYNRTLIKGLTSFEYTASTLISSYFKIVNVVVWYSHMFPILAMKTFCDYLHLKVCFSRNTYWYPHMVRQIIYKSFKMCSEAGFINIKWMRFNVTAPFMFAILTISANDSVISFTIVILLWALLAILDSFNLKEVMIVKFMNTSWVRDTNITSYKHAFHVLLPTERLL